MAEVRQMNEAAHPAAPVPVRGFPRRQPEYDAYEEGRKSAERAIRKAIDEVRAILAAEKKSGVGQSPGE